MSNKTLSKGMSSIKSKAVQWQGLFDKSNDMMGNETNGRALMNVKRPLLSKDGYSLTSLLHD